MNRKLFCKLVEEEFPRAVPERFWPRIKNVAILVERDVPEEIRKEHGLKGGETLLGLYGGVPLTERGSMYGVGMTMPDTITLFQQPIEEEAASHGGGEKRVRQVIRETIWHEVAHYFGFDEHEVGLREKDDS